MIFRIENFGPIKAFEMDLSKDMHLLYGKNSVGKSYAVGVLYLFLKHFLELDFKRESERLSLNISFKGFILEKKGRIDLTENVEKEISKLLKSNFLNNFSNGIRNSLELKEISENALIKFETENFRFNIICIKNKFSADCFLKKSLFITNDSEYNIYLDELFIDKYITHDFQNENLKNILLFLFKDSTYKLHKIYFLPTSRSGLYPLWSSMGSIFAWIAKNRFGMNKSIEIPALSEYISDYFLNISNSQYGAYKEYAKKNRKNCFRRKCHFR